MKVHSDNLTTADFYKAGAIAKVGIVSLSPEGSRSKTHGYKVYLTGSAKHMSQHNYSIRAASWDEWGYFLAHLFSVDPDAVCGPYKGISDFDSQTDWRFSE